jgi:hypothetical protein
VCNGHTLNFLEKSSHSKFETFKGLRHATKQSIIFVNIGAALENRDILKPKMRNSLFNTIFLFPISYPHIGFAIQAERQKTLLKEDFRLI